MLRRVVGTNSFLGRLCPKILGCHSAANFSTTQSKLFPKVEVEGTDINYEVVGSGPQTVLCLPGLVGECFELYFYNC